jgi:hypothetical protein
LYDKKDCYLKYSIVIIIAKKIIFSDSDKMTNGLKEKIGSIIGAAKNKNKILLF